MRVVIASAGSVFQGESSFCRNLFRMVSQSVIVGPPANKTKDTMIELYRTDRFKMNENGTCYAGAGTYTNCAGKIGITVSIEPTEAPELQFVWAEDPDWQGDPHNADDLPGALLDPNLRRYAEKGAREGFTANAITGGYRFTLISAWMGPTDYPLSPIKRASFVAVIKWLAHHGLSKRTIEHKTD